jgi:hypothetical protein
MYEVSSAILEMNILKEGVPCQGFKYSMVIDSNRAWLAKMKGRRLQEEALGKPSPTTNLQSGIIRLSMITDGNVHDFKKLNETK